MYSSPFLSLKIWDNVDSTNAVAIPKNAETHIHRSAPGPPTETAPVTPKILPGPTRIAVDRKKDAKGEMPVLALLLFSTSIPLLNFLT